MKHPRESGWRAREGGEMVFFATEYVDDDGLSVCAERVSIHVPASDDHIEQVEQAVEAVRAAGYEPFGCFNCKYFCRSGAHVDAASPAGYCIDGKHGKHLRQADGTTMTDSCAGQVIATDDERASAIEAWIGSLPKP